MISSIIFLQIMIGIWSKENDHSFPFWRDHLARSLAILLKLLEIQVVIQWLKVDRMGVISFKNCHACQETSFGLPKRKSTMFLQSLSINISLKPIAFAKPKAKQTALASTSSA